MIDINKIQKRKKTSRPNFIGLYLNDNNCVEFREYCKKHNVTYSAVINALIGELLHGLKHGQQD